MCTLKLRSLYALAVAELKALYKQERKAKLAINYFNECGRCVLTHREPRK